MWTDFIRKYEMKLRELIRREICRCGLLGSSGPTETTSIWVGTQAEYDAIADPSPTTLYFIQ